MSVHTVRLPDNLPALSLNDRPNKFARNSVVQQWRQIVKSQVKRARVPEMTRAEVVLHVTPPTNRRRDATNYVATYKAAIDGLVDAGRLPGDDTRYLVDRMPVLEPPDGSGLWRWLLVITDLTPATAAAGD